MNTIPVRDPDLLQQGSVCVLPNGAKVTLHRLGQNRGAWGATGDAYPGLMDGADFGSLRLDLDSSTSRHHARGYVARRVGLDDEQPVFREDYRLEGAWVLETEQGRWSFVAEEDDSAGTEVGFGVNVVPGLHPTDQTEALRKVVEFLQDRMTA